jgi:DNA-binding NtrC family response regulator
MATTLEKAPSFRRGPALRFTLRLVYSGAAILAPPALFTPGRGATPIGREVPRGIALSGDPRASRHHATVHADVMGRLRVVDEGSRNGTWVNGARVEQRRLDDGDVVAVGDSFFVVRGEPEGTGDAEVPALVGVSPGVRALRASIARVGATTATVLLLAESGCGKEVVARALHDAGRPSGPFVAVNCAAIPESLAESQLFGHLAGAFSGAVARPGLFRAADGGTLFLDEVGDLPAPVQPKLLRVLQDRMVLPLGATTPAPCDVRIVAATNRDLKDDVAARRFRGDLFARLAEISLGIPRLRERREDILLLLRHALGDPEARITPALAEALLLHPFPYNVREVFALASQLRIGGGELLDVQAVADRLGAEPEAAPAAAPEDDEAREPPPDRDKLLALLEAHRGVVSEVAKAMKRSRKQVYRWIAHHGIDVKAARGG